LWAVLLFAGCQFAALVCMSLLARRWYNRERARLEAELSEAIRAFITAPDAATASPLAILMDNAATLLASRFVQQIKVMLGGIGSGEAKEAQLALINEASESNPWLAMLSNLMPKRMRNALLKNPQMIGALSKLGGNHSGTGAEVAPRRHRD
jgi:MFS family permease